MKLFKFLWHYKFISTLYKNRATRNCKRAEEAFNEF